MHKLETNDWLVLNNIIYKIYTTKDFDKMRSELMERLKLLLDFDSGDFLSAKNQLNPLAKYLIPINIFLGIIAVILGITLRGF